MWARFMAVLLVGGMLCSAAIAAEDAPAGKATQRTGKTLADWQLAGCLLIDNQGEIAVAKFAKERASSDAVRDFAEMMISDHGEFVQKLREFHPAQQSERRQDAGAAGVARSAVQAGATGLDFLAVKREIAEQCQKSIERELGRKEGAEFDRCYMGGQVMAYMHMLDALTVFKRHASPELAQLIDDGLQTTETHLKHAKAIAEKLDGARTARRDTDRDKE